MADAISIPSEFKFKEMLSHTFPGFFLALSIFMLIDYLSPADLTTYSMSNLTGMISFAGFIIIIGTILGVIIDGIHHTFIEDDIFDNFKTIHELKMPIKRELKASNCNDFTRHFFFSKIGDKGAKSIELENHLDEAYYRYSEFYSNIFISLVIFSIISPFYIFEILEISWNRSILIGIVSLLTACICLTCSYTSYKTYLQAQCSAICGFAKDKESEFTRDCKERSAAENPDKYTFLGWAILILMINIFIIILFNIIGLLSYSFTSIKPFIIPFLVELIGAYLIGTHIFRQKSDEGKEVTDFLKDINEKYQEFSKKHIECISQLIEYEKEPNEKKKDEILADSLEAKKCLNELANKYQISRAKELSNNIQKLMNDLANPDIEKSKIADGIKCLDDLASQLAKANKLGNDIQELVDYLKEPDKVASGTKEEKSKMKELRNNIQKLIDMKDLTKPCTCLNGLANQLSEAKRINIPQLIVDLKKQDCKMDWINNIMEFLSRSSSAALFSIVVSLFAFMIVLATSYTPINLNVETTSINFSENITDETSIKNPVETLYLKNFGKELNNITLSINGIENNWLEIGYVNEKGKIEKKSNTLTIKEITSGETKFAQIRLNSSGMDRKNISQGSYIGSIDINYGKDMKSIPLHINLAKK